MTSSVLILEKPTTPLTTSTCFPVPETDNWPQVSWPACWCWAPGKKSSRHACSRWSFPCCRRCGSSTDGAGDRDWCEVQDVVNRTKNKTILGGGHLELVHHVGVEVLGDLRSIEVAARYWTPDGDGCHGEDLKTDWNVKNIPYQTQSEQLLFSYQLWTSREPSCLMKTRSLVSVGLDWIKKKKTKYIYPKYTFENL